MGLQYNWGLLVYLERARLILFVSVWYMLERGSSLREEGKLDRCVLHGYE